MKKLFAIAALAAVALTSCVENEVITPNNEITFNAVNSKNTKAEVYGPIIGVDYPVDEHFGVYAFHSANAFADTYMDNIEVEKYGAESYWRHATDTYYWPKDASLKFACYSPKAFGAGNVSANATEGIQFVDFTTTNNLGEQVDLMISKVSPELTAGPVNVQFNHLLSQIKFTVKTDKNYGVYDKVESFKINSVKFTPYTQADYVSTDGANAAGYWSNRDLPVEYNALASEYYITKDGSKQEICTPVMIIPQDAVTITVNYTIDYDGTNVITTDFDIVPTGITAWGRNTIYIYNITIGLDEIKFEPEVVDWATPAVEENVTII